MAEKNTYTKDELAGFRKLILDKIESAQEDLDVLRAATANDSDNGTEDTSPTFKQFEEGSSTLSKEENIKTKWTMPLQLPIYTIDCLARKLLYPDKKEEGVKKTVYIIIQWIETSR